MNEFINALPGGAGTIAAAFVAAIVGLAAYIPKLLNSMKVDSQESTALRRIDTLEKRSVEQSEMIHALQVKFTKAISALISIRAWHDMQATQLPPHLTKTFSELLDEHDDHNT